MIGFSHCKINLGLNVVARREDGYHDVETLFYCLDGLSDGVEIVRSGVDSFSSSGILVDCPEDKNLCVKALSLMRGRFTERAFHVAMHLHKTIPLGAGLGGGSANATEVLRMLDELWGTNLSDRELESLAGELGSDTSFFVRKGVAFATSRGEVLEPYNGIDLSGYYILLAKPNMGISTAQAFDGVTPSRWQTPLRKVVGMPITEWKRELKNDFEPSVFKQLPYLARLKEQMYENGAIYSAMSGSGSTIFGIFETKPTLSFDHYYKCVKL